MARASGTRFVFEAGGPAGTGRRARARRGRRRDRRRGAQPPLRPAVADRRGRRRRRSSSPSPTIRRRRAGCWRRCPPIGSTRRGGAGRRGSRRWWVGRVEAGEPARRAGLVEGRRWRSRPGSDGSGPAIVNVYLIEEAGAITIVDAGLPGYWARSREAELRRSAARSRTSGRSCSPTPTRITSASPNASGASGTCPSASTMRTPRSPEARPSSRTRAGRSGSARSSPSCGLGLRHGWSAMTSSPHRGSTTRGAALEPRGSPRVIRVVVPAAGSAASPASPSAMPSSQRDRAGDALQRHGRGHRSPGAIAEHRRAYTEHAERSLAGSTESTPA